MPTHTLLLRGINLGPTTQLAMADLRELVTGLGHADVRTHLRSGNVVLTSRDASPDELADQVEQAITDQLGMETRVIVRTRNELAAVIADNPLRDAEADPARFLVNFLSGDQDRTLVDELNPDAFHPDQFWIQGREIYQWCPNGVSKTKLTPAFWDKQRLGVIGTARNWNTVMAVMRLLDS